MTVEKLSKKVPKRHDEGCGIVRQRDMDTMNVVANAEDSFMSDDFKRP
jgi:hypothetical protein